MGCRHNFPIAITGFGVRFPGNVYNEETFWDLIYSGSDGIVDIPSDRWDLDRFYDPDPDKPGKMYVKKGGFCKLLLTNLMRCTLESHQEKRLAWIHSSG